MTIAGEKNVCNVFLERSDDFLPDGVNDVKWGSLMPRSEEIVESELRATIANSRGKHSDTYDEEIEDEVRRNISGGPDD